MSSLTYWVEEDYDIKIKDYLTGQYISLSGDGYCGVTFDGVGTAELREAVFDVSGGDGIQFGTEYRGVTNWTITGNIHSGTNKFVQGSSEDTWNTWSALSRAWTEYPERLQPRAVVPLYFRRPGRDPMVVFGRPNRIDPVTAKSHAGFISYTATFRQSDPRFFSADEESLVIISGTTPYAGGFVIDTSSDGFELPFSTTLFEPKAGTIYNSGDVATPITAVIEGPINNPQIVYYGPDDLEKWRIKLNITIADGDTVTIDARHWARSITNQDGAGVAGAYVGDRLQNIVLQPGIGRIEFGGNDITGTSTCEILYRNAWAST